jgi:hypothetical protein
MRDLEVSGMSVFPAVKAIRVLLGYAGGDLGIAVRAELV